MPHRDILKSTVQIDQHGQQICTEYPERFYTTETGVRESKKLKLEGYYTALL